MTACDAEPLRRNSRRLPAMGLLLAAGLLAATAGPGLLAQTLSDSDGPLMATHDTSTGKAFTNDTVIRMTKAGLDDSVIIRAIATTPARFTTTPEELIALKEAGVSSHVITAMQAKSAGLAIHVDDTGADGRIDIRNQAAPRLEEIGVYYRDKKGYWIPLKTERLNIKSGGWVKSTLTYGIIKQDRNGDVDGPHSPLLLPPGTQIVFYVPDGTLPEEYTFLRFREKGDRREFRVFTGGVFHNETGSERDELEFTAERLAPRTYTFTLPNEIENGEYALLPPGSSNIQGVNGVGKIFTFRVVDGRAPKNP